MNSKIDMERIEAEGQEFMAELEKRLSAGEGFTHDQALSIYKTCIFLSQIAARASHVIARCSCQEVHAILPTAWRSQGDA